MGARILYEKASYSFYRNNRHLRALVRAQEGLLESRQKAMPAGDTRNSLPEEFIIWKIHPAALLIASNNSLRPLTLDQRATKNARNNTQTTGTLPRRPRPRTKRQMLRLISRGLGLRERRRIRILLPSAHLKSSQRARVSREAAPTSPQTECFYNSVPTYTLRDRKYKRRMTGSV